MQQLLIASDKRATDASPAKAKMMQHWMPSTFLKVSQSDKGDERQKRSDVEDRVGKD